MRRVIITDKDGTPIGELSPENVYGLVRKEEVNGEHSLAIDTDMVLQKGWRILTQDGRGIWREHVVYSIDDMHDRPGPIASSCWCIWSVMYDLAGTRVSRMPGVTTPVGAEEALIAALSGTTRWEVGTVTNLATGGASMYDMSGWEAVKVLLDNWGGELDATIEVSGSTVVSRKVDLYLQQGESTATRRFDFGADLKSVNRKMEEGPLYCRVTPRGKGEQTEGGGYGRKITIESVNDGKDYLEDAQMVPIARVPDGNGGWEYPTVEIENSDCETPQELKDWALEVMEDYTRPKMTYSVDVLQASAEGMDAHGLSLGDAVHLVDRTFGEDGLRLSGRVSSMTVDMLNEADVSVTIGNISQGLGGMLGSMLGQFESISNNIQSVMERQAHMATAQYVSELLDRINTEVNALGGYTYITEGQGLRTYDVAVSDPLVGSEASMVVEIKGGNIRIANSRTSGGDWDWKTVLQSGHILAELITAAHITTGYIGSAGGTYINLDQNIVHLGDDTKSHVRVDDSGIYLMDGDVYAAWLTSKRQNSGGAIIPADATIGRWLRFAIRDRLDTSIFEVDTLGNVGFTGQLISDTFAKVVSSNDEKTVQLNTPTAITSLTIPAGTRDLDEFTPVWLFFGKVQVSGTSGKILFSANISTNQDSWTSLTSIACAEVEGKTTTIFGVYRNNYLGDRDIYLNAYPTDSNTPSGGARVSARLVGVRLK